MTPLPLRLRPGERLLDEPAAWFVPGAEPRVWLAEILAWGVALHDLSLLVVPTSRTDRSPCGVLAVPGAGASPALTVRALPYARRTGNVFQPADATLEPPITERELQGLLVQDWSILHPSAGLVGYGAEDVLRIEDLLEPPPRLQSTWDRANPGMVPGAGLIAVEPEREITIDVLFEDESGDIATDPPKGLPPAPKERGFRPIGRLGQGLAGAVHWLCSKAPSGASHPTWINRLMSWAEERKQYADRRLEDRRARALERLLHQLESDPERGLRHALPLWDAGSRGLGTPGDTLTPRNTDFDLGSLGGGRPADPWGIPPDVQRQLEARYRELANREIRLGRHRRAAYIFAALLGDLDSAAAVLKEGRHFREAAVLYRDKLHQPLQAARCLEEGGLLTEAIDLYETQRRYEKAGDLYRRLEQEDHAEIAYRRAVKTHREAGELLKAARLLEKKLAAPDEALDLLQWGWPHSACAKDCLTGQLELLGRLRRHEQTSLRIETASEVQNPEHQILLAEVLAGTAGTYPNPEVRAAAADRTRVLAGGLLRHASKRQMSRLLAAVRGIDPKDALLVRDTQRYLRQRPEPRRLQAPAESRIEHSVILPDDVQWLTAASTPRQFLAAGRNKMDGQGVLAAWDWGSEPTVRDWMSAVDPADMRLEPPLNDDQGFLLGLAGNGQLLEELHLGLESNRQPFTIPRELRGFARSEDGILWLLYAPENENAVLSAYRQNRLLQSMSLHVHLDGSRDWPWPLPIAVVDQEVFYAVDDHLIRATFGAEPQILHVVLPTDIHGLLARRGGRQPVLVALLSGGIALVDTRDFSYREHLRDMVDPCATFTSTGELVVADQNGISVSRLRGGSLEARKTIGGRQRRIIDVMPGPSAGHIALLTDRGEVQVLRTD